MLNVVRFFFFPFWQMTMKEEVGLEGHLPLCIQMTWQPVAPCLVSALNSCGAVYLTFTLAETCWSLPHLI